MVRLAVRTLPVFAIIIGFAVALAAYLNFSGVRTAYLDLTRARMEMIANAVGLDIVAANALGITLPEQVTLPELLARQSATDPSVRSIDVAGSDGYILFSSDPQRIGVASAEEPDVMRQTLDVTNDFGMVIGVVDVRLERTGIEAAVERLRVDLFAGAVPVGLGAAFAGCLGALFLLSQLHRRARRVSDDSHNIAPIDRAHEQMARLGTGGAA